MNPEVYIIPLISIQSWYFLRYSDLYIHNLSQMPLDTKSYMILPKIQMKLFRSLCVSVR